MPSNRPCRCDGAANDRWKYDEKVSAATAALLSTFVLERMANSQSGWERGGARRGERSIGEFQGISLTAGCLRLFGRDARRSGSALAGNFRARGNQIGRSRPRDISPILALLVLLLVRRANQVAPSSVEMRFGLIE